MTRGQSLGIADRGIAENGIVPVGANQTRAGALIEREPEPGVRCRRHDRLIDILNCFDEVGLADDDVGLLGDFHAHRKQIDHDLPSARAPVLDAFLVLSPDPPNVAACLEIDTHNLSGCNEQRNLYRHAVLQRGFFSTRLLL